MKKNILFIGACLLVCVFGGANAQTSVNASGGNATGSSGSASYSVGQVFNQTYSSASGSVSEGVQQPLELLTTGVDDIESFLQSFAIYPNPVKQYLYLQKKQEDGVRTTYRLLDLNGKILQTGEVTNTLQSINMQKYAAAVYFLEIIQPNKKSQTFKVIKK